MLKQAVMGSIKQLEQLNSKYILFCDKKRFLLLVLNIKYKYLENTIHRYTINYLWKKHFMIYHNIIPPQKRLNHRMLVCFIETTLMYRCMDQLIKYKA